MESWKTDLIKRVMDGLDHHIADPDGSVACTGCPYNDEYTHCLNRLHIDALKLLKSRPQIDMKNFHRATRYFRDMEFVNPDDKRWGEFGDAMDEIYVFLDEMGLVSTTLSMTLEDKKPENK